MFAALVGIISSRNTTISAELIFPITLGGASNGFFGTAAHDFPMYIEGATNNFIGTISNIFDIGVAGGGTVVNPAGDDPYFNDVVFLLETALPNSITDATGKTITNISGVTVSGAQYQVGTSSAYANGSSYLYASPDAAFDFGTGDFTMEGWFYLTADTGLNPVGRRDATILGCWEQLGNYNTWQVFILGDGSTTGNAIVFDSFSNSVESYLIASTAINKNTWVNFAVVRQSDTLTIYVNGTAVNSGSFTAPVNSGGNFMRVASLQPGGAGLFFNYFPGYLQQLRITKGVARYTADFIPSAVPFPTN
jgi:hypothetical protein